MIYTIEQANDHNTLLDIKERIEEKHKEGFNIINRMPRIKIMSNIEADKANPVDEIKLAYKANEDKKESPVDEISPADKANPVDKINYRSQVGVVYAPDPALARPHETAPPSFCRFSNFVFGFAVSLCLTLAVRVLGCWLLPYSISVCSVGNESINIASLLLLL
jgi:hypothetical protein